MPNHEINQLCRKLRKQGWTVERRNSGHLKLTSPSGAFYFTAATPGDVRAKRNREADLRRMGAKL